MHVPSTGNVGGEVLKFQLSAEVPMLVTRLNRSIFCFTCLLSLRDETILRVVSEKADEMAEGDGLIFTRSPRSPQRPRVPG
jgi:hypothetical protein